MKNCICGQKDKKKQKNRSTSKKSRRMVDGFFVNRLMLKIGKNPKFVEGV